MKIRHLLLPLACCFFFQKIAAQPASPQQLDSLERTLAQPLPDSVTVAVLNRLTAAYSRFDPARAQEKIARSLALTASFAPGRWSDSSSFFRQQAHTFVTFGNLHFRQGKHAEALENFYKSLRVAEKNSDWMNVGRAQTGLGTIQYRYGNLEQSLSHHRQAERIFEKNHHLAGVLTAKNNIATLLLEQKRDAEAIQEFKNIGDLAERNAMWEIAAGAWQNSMNYFTDRDSLDRALQLGERSRLCFEKTNDRLNYALLLAKITYIRFLQKNFAEVRQLAQQTLDIGRALNNQLIIRTGFTNLASGFFEEAKLTASPALKDSFYQQSVLLLELEKAHSDSTFSTEKANAIAEMQVKYETEKKEKEISQLGEAANRQKIVALQREIELRRQKIEAETARQQAELLETLNEKIGLELEVNASRLREQQAAGDRDRQQIEILKIKNEQQASAARRSQQVRTGLAAGLAVVIFFSLLLAWMYRQRVRSNEKIRQQSAEIEAQNRELAEANRYKSIFLSNMSHEIRTPLNTIIGMTALLDETPLSEKQKEYAEVARQSSENLLAVINEILDFSKIEAGKIEIHPQPFDLYELLRRQVNQFRWQAERKNISLDLKIGSDVPTGIEADPARLNQILLNLLGNAFKFTEKGSISLEADRIDRLPDGRELLRFAVRDTGVGIAAAEAGRVFESFRQTGDHPHLQQGGTGLGLAIARQLVELQGGEIWVESRLGEGSVFQFSLPAKAVELPPVVVVSENAAAANFSDSLKISKKEKPLAGLEILLVEDNQFNQMLAIELLKKLVAEPKITIAENGLEAQQRVESQRFDLIFMDIKMPVMDGFAATAALRAAKIQTPIIALTANATAEERAKCLAAGMDDYLPKPIAVDLLEAKIRQWA